MKERRHIWISKHQYANQTRIYRNIQNSQSISFKKERATFNSTKKTKHQNEADKHKGKKEEAEFKNIEQRNDQRLVAKFENLEQKQQEAEDNLDRLSELYGLGVVDEDRRLIKDYMS